MAAINYSLVCSGGNAGSYWSGLTTEQRLRYGPSGSERVYSGIVNWLSARTSSGELSLFVGEVCEIGDAFTESGTQAIVDLPAAFVLITPTVAGVPTTAYHNGSVSSGYVFYGTSNYIYGIIKMSVLNSVIEGVRIVIQDSSSYGVSLAAMGATARYCIISGENTPLNASCRGIYCGTPGSIVHNNLIFNTGRGIVLNSYAYAYGALIYNNISAKNLTGIYFGTGGLTQGYPIICNNICVGNTTANWDVSEPTTYMAWKNAGESGDTVWGTDSITIATTDFADYDNNDFYPASALSPQVDAGGAIYLAQAKDIKLSVRPNYDPEGAENWDVGCFEYDHGNGLAPTTVAVEIDGMVEGSVLAIYKTSDNSEILAPTTIGATGAYSMSYTYVGDVSVDIVVRKSSSGTKYYPYRNPATIGANGLSLTVSQVPDTIAV